MIYKDPHDVLTKLYVSNCSPGIEVWEDMELRSFNLLKPYFLEKGIDKVLDIGCGEGRLGSYFLNYCDSLVMADPDLVRITTAEKKLSEYKNRIFFVRSSIQSSPFPHAFFDFILCSHVLQHIESNNFSSIIEKLIFQLKKSGILLVSTTITTKVDDYIFYVRKHNNKIIRNVKTRDCKIKSSQDGLYVRHFSLRQLKNLFSSWVCDKFIIYHTFLKDKLIVHQPIIYEEIPLQISLDFHSADVMLLLKPQRLMKEKAKIE